MESNYNNSNEVSGGIGELINMPQIYERLWAIILAGGNGERTRDLIDRWKGRHIPKQYCAFVGTRSMLQHTLDRADLSVKRDNQRIIIARVHEHEARLQLAEHWPGRVIVQPSNHDTLPGIFLPLTYIYTQDRNATIVIYPSDHFIYPGNKFAEVITRAVRAVEELPKTLLLIGAHADSPECDYGWICPGPQIWSSGKDIAYAVRQFVEKPDHSDAAAAMACGGLWNTLIIVVKAHTLWRLGWIYFPEIMQLFERLLRAVGSSHETEVLEEIYEAMPTQNFSTGLLTLAADQIGVLPMNGILWSDWGKDTRIVETLVKIGKQPNFLEALSDRNIGEKYVSVSGF
jgi:mannose-1-phosphate guanylyltransferase